MNQENTANENRMTGGAGQARAVGLFLLKRYEEALSAYDELSAQEPDNMTFQVNRMICQTYLSEPDAGFFDDMLQLVNRLPVQGYLCLADILYRLERSEEALVFVNKALEKEAGNVDACLLKARLLDQMEKNQELFEFVNSFYPRLKRDERVLCFAAYYAVLFWNLRQAERFLKKALKINRYAVLQNDCFYVCLANLKSVRQIVFWAEKALEDREDSVIALRVLSKYYTDLGWYEKACEAHEKLSRLIRLSDDMLIRWAYCLFMQAEYAQAFDLLERVSVYSDVLFDLLRKVLLRMRRAGQMQTVREKIAQWREVHEQNPVTDYLFAAVSGEDVPDTVPVPFIRLVEDISVVERLQNKDGRGKYYGADVLKKALTAAEVPENVPLSVLDLGCGTGEAASVLAEYGTVAGVDVSSNALLLAKENSSYGELSETDIVSFCSEARGEYDLIVCLDSLYYFSGLTPVFEAVKKILKPEGLFVFTVRSQDGEKDFEADCEGRFAHSVRFVSECLQATGFEEKYQAEKILYRSDETDMKCHIFAVRKA